MKFFDFFLTFLFKKISYAKKNLVSIVDNKFFKMFLPKLSKNCVKKFLFSKKADNF